MTLQSMRPDPDELLKKIQAEERGRGKLKIFLGDAAGRITIFSRGIPTYLLNRFRL